MAESERKYKFTNTTDHVVHIKEMRRALSPGAEREWEGVVGPSRKLEDQGLIKIEDLGPGDSSKAKKKKSASREKMARDVKHVLTSRYDRTVERGKASPAKASEVGTTKKGKKSKKDKKKTAPPPPPPTPVTEEAPKSRLDSLMGGQKDGE